MTVAILNEFKTNQAAGKASCCTSSLMKTIYFVLGGICPEVGSTTSMMTESPLLTSISVCHHVALCEHPSQHWTGENLTATPKHQVSVFHSDTSKSVVRTLFKSRNTLRQKLVHPKDYIPHGQQKATWCMQFNAMKDALYSGETKQNKCIAQHRRVNSSGPDFFYA